MTAAETKKDTNIVTLTIDGTEIAVPKGTTVYNAARQLKIDIPIFCYQDRMPPFGACRMCLVSVEKMPKLQTSCTLEATEGMIVHTQAEAAVKGRKDILELLLINHPLDCPICDRGGECPLQDQAYSHGPGLSRFFEEKRSFKKHVPLGPVLMLDRERCIVCARCTRFGDIVAGDHALEFMERGYKTEVGTPDGRPAKSKFIGNTIMICPVGALTSQVYRFRARPWDNLATETSCTLCPVGCSMYLDSRDGEIMRTRSKENRGVNDIWLCDKGWFGYEFTSSPERLNTPLIRRNGQLEKATWDDALDLIASQLKTFRTAGKIAAWGGDPLTTEENYLYQKLFRDGFHVNHLDHRIGTPTLSFEEEGLSPGMEISIGECESLSHALLLGLDITEEFPVVWLRLKQAINHKATVRYAGHYKTEVAHHLKQNLIHSPDKDLEATKQLLATLLEKPEEVKKAAIFVGSQYLNSPHRIAILETILEFSQQHPHISFNIMEGHENSTGARFSGMRPDVGLMGLALSKPGFTAHKLVAETIEKDWDYLHVAGSNPAVQFDQATWDQFRKKLKFLVVQDLFLTETAAQADVVLPTLSYVEKRGSFINIEGRVQHIQPGKEIPHNVFSDADIFIKLGQLLNIKMHVESKFIEALQSGHIFLERPASLKKHAETFKIDSTSLKATFKHQLFDGGVRMRHNPKVKELASYPHIYLHPETAENYKLQDKDEATLTIGKCSIKGIVKLDKGLAEKTVALPLGFTELPLQNLGVPLMNGIVIEVSKTER